MNPLLMPLAFGLPGVPEWIVIFVLVLIFFGPKKLPEVAKSIGQGMREFKKIMNAADEELQNATRDVTHSATEEPPPRQIAEAKEPKPADSSPPSQSQVPPKP